MNSSPSDEFGRGFRGVAGSDVAPYQEAEQ